MCSLLVIVFVMHDAKLYLYFYDRILYLLSQVQGHVMQCEKNRSVMHDTILYFKCPK
jgi:ABC-type hemin transport system ATPase subunit